MAIWHYNFYLELNQKDKIETFLKCILNLYKIQTTTSNGIIFGNLDDNFIEVTYNNGKIYNISGGFNLLSVQKGFIEKVIKLLIDNNITIKNLDNCVIENIKDNILQSNAYKYANKGLIP